MKIANSIRIKVYIKEEEDFDKIKKSLLELIPFDLEKEKVELKEELVQGFDEKEIKILRFVLDKNRHIEAFLNNLNEKLFEETKERILSYAESRLDDDCNFFLRFSKEKWVEEKLLWLTDQGNCFHIKMNVAAFPKKKEIAMKIIRNIFKG
ncbi:MAG: RNA-binding domain-containing protein [Candidatus Woesearchaeota archaeon]